MGNCLFPILSLFGLWTWVSCTWLFFSCHRRSGFSSFRLHLRKASCLSVTSSERPTLTTLYLKRSLHHHPVPLHKIPESFPWWHFNTVSSCLVYVSVYLFIVCLPPSEHELHNGGRGQFVSSSLPLVQQRDRLLVGGFALLLLPGNCVHRQTQSLTPGGQRHTAVLSSSVYGRCGRLISPGWGLDN